MTAPAKKAAARKPHRAPLVFSDPTPATAPGGADAPPPDGPPAPPQAEPAAEPAPEPAAAGEGKPARRPAARPLKRTTRGRRAALPSAPARQADKEPTTPFQVRMPDSLHFRFKVAVLHQGTDMSRIVIEMARLYVAAPELWEDLFQRAIDERTELHELVGDALAGVLDTAGEEEG